MIKDSIELKAFVEKTLKEKKAENIVTLELDNEVFFTKYMVFASGKSKKSVSSIAEFLSDELKHKAGRTITIEGLRNSDWVLIDCGDIVVHIFHPDARSYYNVEENWFAKLSKNKK